MISAFFSAKLFVSEQQSAFCLKTAPGFNETSRDAYFVIYKKDELVCLWNLTQVSFFNYKLVYIKWQ